MEYFCQDEAFLYGYLYHTTAIKNTVWQNLINSITNQDIDLKFLKGMDCCMAHIFVTVNFSEKCLFMGVTFSFEYRLGQSYQDVDNIRTLVRPLHRHL